MYNGRLIPRNDTGYRHPDGNPGLLQIFKTRKLSNQRADRKPVIQTSGPPFDHTFSQPRVLECLMTDDEMDRIDQNRRHFLTVATAVTGIAGAGAAAVPFLSSLQPSARAQALGAPVEVPVGSMEAGFCRRTSLACATPIQRSPSSSPSTRPTLRARFVRNTL